MNVCNHSIFCVFVCVCACVYVFLYVYVCFVSWLCSCLALVHDILIPYEFEKVEKLYMHVCMYLCVSMYVSMCVLFVCISVFVCLKFVSGWEKGRVQAAVTKPLGRSSS